MASPLEELADHIITHLSQEHPEALSSVSDTEIHRRVIAGIARARSHGFDHPEPVTAFVTLMFLVAPDFDRHPAIARALRTPGPGPDRLRALFEHTSERDWEEAATSTAGWPPPESP